MHALRLYSRLQDDAGLASTYGVLGRASLALGQWKNAARYHEVARAWYERIGDLYGLAHVADCLADLELAANNPSTATVHLYRAIELHYAVGNRHYAARSCRALGLVLRRLDCSDEVLNALNQVITFLETHGEASLAEFAGMLHGRLPGR
jgi:tetratricopeptide (TPR) repeat protein